MRPITPPTVPDHPAPRPPTSNMVAPTSKPHPTVTSADASAALKSSRPPCSLLSTPPTEPVLSLTRDQLFSHDVAREHGLDPLSMPILEIPSASSKLYDTLLFYAAHFAVDLDQPLPPSAAPSDFADDYDQLDADDEREQQNGNRHADADDNSDTDDAADSDGDCQRDADALPTAAVAGGDESSHVCAHPEQQQQEQQQQQHQNKQNKQETAAAERAYPLLRNVIRGASGAMLPRREGAGKLSSLWSCPDDRTEPYLVFSDSEYDSDASSDLSDDDDDTASQGDADECANGKANGSADDDLADLLPKTASLGALKRKAEPPVQRYHMGLGYAKVAVGDSVVLLNHVAFGLPVGTRDAVHLFRSVVLAAASTTAVQELCAVAMRWRNDREHVGTRAAPGRFTLYRFKTDGDGRGYWVSQGFKRARPSASVILPDGQLAAIVRDIRDFVARETKVWYEAHGLPHRRSFLFHGPPGRGKTSTIKMIAGMFRLNACFLSFTMADFSNQTLQDALADLPRRALLVLEDVDVLFTEDRKSETSSSLTFSGLLNALDGLISVDGVITMFTTNHIEKLDKALIRGGRVDRRFEFVHPNVKQLGKLFKSFYGDADDALAAKFASIVLDRPEEEARSIATLQQHFIYTRKASAEESVRKIPEFFAEFYPKGAKARNHLYL